ncbi:4368_t:CDS:2, partial [Dentiscutata erythropus]
MFASYYNPVESEYLSEKCSQTSNFKFAPQNNSSCSSRSHHRSESYYNSCSIFNIVSKLSDIEQK